MKRLNLLPPELRPRGGNIRTSTYAVLGGLLLATLAMTLYWFVQSGANTTANEIEGLQKETQAAKEDANALGPYAEFSAMKDARARSVRLVAETRFDYERLTRELTRILPEHVWITGLDVGPTELELAEGADSVEATAAAGALSVNLSGCAPDQPTVADALDRLTALTGATSVNLGASGDGSVTGARSSGSGGGESLLQSSSSGGGAACTGSVSFEATVDLANPAQETTGL
jgi:Tfp pilus assembly protein PilN